MCGIVGFIGNTGNNLTRVLAGLGAILYRAPDSTGITWFGDDTEPFRVRKCIGSVPQLVEVLMDESPNPNFQKTLFSLWNDNYVSDGHMRSIQKKLLQCEGFSNIVSDNGQSQEIDDEKDETIYSHCCPCNKSKYPPTWDAISKGTTENNSVLIYPGTRGSIAKPLSLKIDSPKKLQDTIYEFVYTYDLSPVITRMLIRAMLKRILKNRQADEIHDVMEDAVINAFDEVFELCLWSGDEINTYPIESLLNKKKSIDRIFHKKKYNNPHAHYQLWKILSEESISVPEDYDRDGIRCLFRILDTLIISKLSHEPAMSDEIQLIFDKLRPDFNVSSPVLWKIFYHAEKGVNVYGWAAAAVFEYLKKHYCLVNNDLTNNDEEGYADNLDPGVAAPTFLKPLSYAVLAHGRWAMQSPVTVRNTHPFIDARGERSIVLNGQFNSLIEADLHQFITEAGFTYKSDNSSESMALLWGYYFSILKQEQAHSSTVQANVESELVDYYVGSQSINYQIYHKIRGKTDTQIDKIAFIEAARQFTRLGGQIAVSGMSMKTPGCIFVASHNRPVFIAWYPGKESVMVVSDINAAIGLFPQSLVFEKTKVIRELRQKYEAEEKELKRNGNKNGTNEDLRLCKEKYQKQEEQILQAFTITVIPLQGENQFAQIYTQYKQGSSEHHIEITTFDGEPITDIDQFDMVLNPVKSKQDLSKSFYETHVHEIPELLEGILNIYLPKDISIPNLQIRQRFLQRRFGKTLYSLKRLIFVGMGGSYTAGLMAKQFYLSLFPFIDIVVLKPVQVEQISNSVDPETDLVVLCSWSGTTADMVEFAKQIGSHKTVMLCITDKPFSDIALIAQRSAGVIATYTGEEITYTALKSTPCMVFCLNLLAVWLADKMETRKKALERLAKMRKIPGVVEKVLKNRSLTEFCNRVVKRCSTYNSVIVVDAYSFSGIGEEAASKMEENSMATIGRCLDYRDLRAADVALVAEQSFIVVNATVECRLSEALLAMRKLYLAGVPFIAVTYRHRYLEEMRYYAKDDIYELTKVEDSLQPFVDMPFFYMLAYYFSLHLKAGVPGFPRNRVKSVTTSRTRPVKPLSTHNELVSLQKTVEKLQTVTVSGSEQQSYWEKSSTLEWERECYCQMRKMAQILEQDDPLINLTKISKISFNQLGRALFEHNEEGGELVFVCMDPIARAAALDIAYRWNNLLGGIVRVISDWDSLGRFSEDVLLFVVSSEAWEPASIEYLITNMASPAFWLGPILPDQIDLEVFFEKSLGYMVLNDNFSLIPAGLLYTVITLVLSKAWKTHKPERAGIVEQLMANTIKIINPVLNNRALFSDIRHISNNIRTYKTAFYVGPPDGTGTNWVTRFSKTGSMIMEYHFYGDGAHGPLATVDSDVNSKFVLITSEEEMIETYGEALVVQWKQEYLADHSFNEYINKTAKDRELAPNKPFIAEGNWYLPILRPEYDTARDNIIIIDAARERSYNQSLDELSVYGCRYARIVLITQAQFMTNISKKGLFDYPISDYIFLPAVQKNGDAYPIPEYFIPYVMDIIGVALSIADDHKKPIMDLSQENQWVIKHAFSNLSTVLSGKHKFLANLNGSIISALQAIDPLIVDIKGQAEYRVMRIWNEEKLFHLLDEGLVYGSEEVIKRFRILKDQNEPFYLIRPDKKTFTGAAEDHNDYWSEAYGTSWECLKEKCVEIKADHKGNLIVEIPMVEKENLEGRLLQVYTLFMAWNHEHSIESQIGPTIRALSFDSCYSAQRSSRYFAIINAYNEAMNRTELLWADWLLGLVQRSWLLFLAPEEIGRLISNRIHTCLILAGESNIDRTYKLGQIQTAVEAVWNKAALTPAEDDELRWNEFLRLIGNYLQQKYTLS